MNAPSAVAKRLSLVRLKSARDFIGKAKIMSDQKVTSPMTDTKKLREAAERATESKWHAYARGSGIDREYEIRTETGGILFRSTSYGNMGNDAAFIALMRNTILTLIDELDAARGAVEMLAKTLEDTRDLVHEQECRGDEDCDHCLIVYQTIDPALSHPTVQAARAK